MLINGKTIMTKKNGTVSCLSQYLKKPVCNVVTLDDPSMGHKTKI